MYHRCGGASCRLEATKPPPSASRADMTQQCWNTWECVEHKREPGTEHVNALAHCLWGVQRRTYCCVNALAHSLL